MSSATATIPSDLNYFITLEKYLDKSLVKGESWYLVDSEWFKRCRKFLCPDDAAAVSVFAPKAEAIHPGPVDNARLFKEDMSDIREDMRDKQDYTLLPEEAWTMLVTRFGLKEGQQPIKRKVAKHGMFKEVEVYPMELQLAENSNLEDIRKKKFSRLDTLERIQSTMRTEFNIAADSEVKLWHKYFSNTFEQLSKLDHTLQDTWISPGTLIVIEEKNLDGTWPRQTGR